MKVKLINKTQNLLDVIYTGATTCYNAGSPIDKWFEVCTIPTDKKRKLVDKCIKSGHHCYDKDTEVLTEKGFKKWCDVTYFDKLGVFDVKNGCLVGFETPKKLICEEYDGIMYYLDTNKINMMITPNHRMYCSLSNTSKNRINPEFKIYKTEDILDDKKIINKPMRFKSYSNTLLQEEYNPFSLSENKIIHFHKLFGFFIGDGYSTGGNILQFHLKKERKIEYLKKICNELGFEFEIKPNNKINVIYKDLGNFAKNNWYKNDKKYIPECILKCSKNTIENILDGLINSDGSISKNNCSVRYNTTSSQVANMVQSMFILTGYGATMLEKIPKNPKHNNCFLIQKFNRDSMPHINDSRNKKSYIQEKKYKGKIYCAEVSTGLLMVKRGKKKLPYLSGNSVCEHSQFTFAIEGISKASSVQLLRHRHCSFSQQSQRYVEIKESQNELEKLFTDNYTPETYKNSELYKILDKYFVDADKFKNINGYYYALDNYLEAINNGEKAEDARRFLPNATKTNLVVTMNLREFMHICSLRLCSKSQLEIRQLVREMCNVILKDEEWLKPYLQPKCVAMGKCNESKSCGYIESVKGQVNVNR